LTRTIVDILPANFEKKPKMFWGSPVVLLVVLSLSWQVRTLSQSDLCGIWTSLSGVKCTSGQTCSGSAGTNFIVNTGFVFAADGTYLQQFRMATGSCPFPDSSGTLIMAINTLGHYTIGANNTNTSIGVNWTHIVYTPDSFNITLIKNQKAIYYTTSDPGPCMLPLDYWNNSTTGCPCNGTYVVNGSFDTTTNTFVGSREIIPSDCPNGTCPETFFLKDYSQYGNIRLNITGNTKIVELTATSQNSTIGYNYGDANITYTFQATVGSCVPTALTTTGAKTSKSMMVYPSVIGMFMVLVLIILIKP